MNYCCGFNFFVKVGENIMVLFIILYPIYRTFCEAPLYLCKFYHHKT